MKTFSVNTLGCKVNQYEGQQIRQLLEGLGLRAVELDGGPDLVVVNTCCVTHTASAKCRQLISRARKLNPAAHIAVCGCLPTIESDELPAQTAGVTIISSQDQTGPQLTELVRSAAGRIAGGTSEGGLKSFSGHTRAFLKVQDGCDGWCAYCIVPRTRPMLASKPIADVLAEARGLVESGHREIVVSGVFLGAYGLDTVKRRRWSSSVNEHLTELLVALADVEGLRRIRLSSLEPGDITEPLVDVIAANANIMPHLHLSLQSGSDTILKRMCRQYDSSQYREVVAMLKERLDRPAITTDVIVGFPGETEDDFAATMELAQHVGFSRIHVFAYSARQGTAAAKMADKVDPGTIKKRSQQLRNLAEKLARQYRSQFKGETAEVLIEQRSADRATGRAERYFEVEIRHPGESAVKGDIVTVTLIDQTTDGMTARL